MLPLSTNINETFAIFSEVNLFDKDTQYYKYIEDIVLQEKVLEMKNYIQHGNTTCYKHSLNVSYYSYIICKKYGFDAKSAARAGMLHDLFLYDWHNDSEPTKFLDKHAFSHPKIALKNAMNYFILNDIEKDAIEKHMWPVTMSLPKYKESFVIVLVDKITTVLEFFEKFFPIK